MVLNRKQRLNSRLKSSMFSLGRSLAWQNDDERENTEANLPIVPCLGILRRFDFFRTMCGKACAAFFEHDYVLHRHFLARYWALTCRQHD